MDNLVAGKIFIEGTNRGIADLLVVLYDLDPLNTQEYANKGLSIDDPIDGLLTNAVARTWLDFPGDRIGSVLTDRLGHFNLQFDDEEFRIRNSEKRPDLMLLVLGPDRNMGAITISQRLLHYAWIPRVNAGRREHFSIAIDAERLREKGVVLEPGEMDPDTFAARERERIAQQTLLQRNMRTLHREQLAVGAARRTLARSFWLNIGARLLPADLATARLYVPRGESIAETQKQAVAHGIETLRNASIGPGIRLRFRPADLLRFGLDTDRLAAGETVEVSVCDLLAKKGLGSELVRVRGLMDELHARRQGRELIAGDDDNGEEPFPGDEPIDFADSRAFVNNRVLGQLAELPALTRAKSASTIDELQKIKDTINRLELSGGPANVTAFHDFHTLQLAFQDVWTAAFDGELREQVLDLYRQTVALHEDYGLEVPPMEDIADANALREYLAILRNEVAEAAVIPIPPDVQQCYPQLELQVWNRLDEDGRSVLRTAAGNYLRPWSQGNDIDPRIDQWSTQEYLDGEYAKVIKYHQTTPLARTERLIVEVAERLNQPYAFKYFAPGTINYGILVTYRQEWIPDTYQVGRLVSTVPLAPGEERKLKVSRKVNKSRAEKAIEKALMESTAERQFTSRTELDVMAKVASSTNFRMTASGSLSMGIGQISSTSEFAHSQQQEATQQKKQFLEAIQKSAEKVRQETEIHVETNEQFEQGIESDTVLKNPNNELTVTYLLYELERRYRVTSRPHRLTPTVLVAMDIPAPHEITEAWVLEHAWILKRTLLDDHFQDAIAYIEDGLSGDSIDIEVKKANWDTARETLAQLESDFERLIELRNTRQDTIVGLLEGENLAKAEELDDGARVAAAIFSGGLSELFGGGTSDRDEVMKARREAAEKALEYLQSRIEALSERVSLARKSATEAADAYASAVQHKTRKDTAIRQLKLHLRQNILHYMHAIWDYKHQDQQFFELHDLEVPFLEPATRNCRLRRATAEEIDSGIPGVVRDGEVYIASCGAPEPPPVTGSLPTRRLGTVADLNRPLGYKGNYIIYPLKGCSYLTDYMSQDFVDDYFGLRDPSTELAYTGEELLAYAGELLNDSEAALTDAERDALIRAVSDYLTSPAKGSETVILPTGQLYMEALKGEQTLLEDFKLAHRGLDVLKVQEEVRAERLENLRRAARIVATAPNLEDPDIEKTVVVRGDEVQVPIDVES